MTCFNTTPIKIIGSLFIATALTACGGSSTSSFNPSTSFDDIVTNGADLAAELSSIPYTDPTTLPTSGNATYDGYIGVETSGGTNVGGDLSLTANFSNNRLSGNASNFFDDDNNAYDGRLLVSNSSIDRTTNTSVDFTFEADLDGNLTGPDGDISVDAFLQGDFTGTDYRYVEGGVVGTATAGDETQFIVGEFVGKR